MSKAIEFLNAHKSSTPSNWREEAQWRRDNQKWLTYARVITARIMRAMDEQSVTQVILAERMGCTQQYVSNLLKGSSNMTLETISKIEDALRIDILQSSLNSVIGYSECIKPKECYLNDSGMDTYNNSQRDYGKDSDGK